jgi:MFS-type transporter involved in bile tolerance (Atg22 family)
MALINCLGAFGGFFGVLLVGALQTHTGSPAAGFLLMSLSLILSGVVLLGMGLPPAGDALRAEVPRENVAK